MEPVKGGRLVNLPDEARDALAAAGEGSPASFALRFAAGLPGVEMVLSGMGDTVAAYVCYALDRLSRVYEARGEGDLAGLRRLQARAVAESFDCDPAAVPAELSSLDAELFS